MAEFRSEISDKAVVRALNKVAAQAKTAASKEIRAAGYNMKAADIKKRIKVTRATAANPVAMVRVTGPVTPLIEFDARQTREGVSVKVKNGRKLIRHAFIATMESGHRGVFIRKDGKQPGRRGRPILNRDIEQLYGPAVPDGFNNVIVKKALVAVVTSKFPAILKHEIEYLRLK